MKKIIGTSAMLLCLAVVPAAAQGLSFGVKGGVTNAKLNFDKDLFSGKGRYGWFIGPSLKLNLPLMLGADAAVLYDQREVKISGDEGQTMKIKQISIPVNARLNFDLPAGTGIYVALGPQVAFNVGDSEFKWGEKESYETTFQMKKSAFSLNFGAGVTLLSHLEVGFAYNVEMGSTGDITWDKLTDKNSYKDDSKVNTWKIQATYYF